MTNLGSNQLQPDLGNGSWEFFIRCCEGWGLCSCSVPVLLREGHQLNLNKPLRVAAQQGRTEVCSLLLHHGANIDSKNVNGFTAMILASQQGHSDTVKMLHERGADVFATNRQGASAITQASQHNRAQTVQYLVEQARVVLPSQVMM